MSPHYSQSDSVIVILGGSNDSDGALSQMSLDRCQQAVSLHTAHPKLRLVTTGGWGEHFNQTATAHGELVKRELIRQGISEKLFLPVPHSAYTEADAIETSKVIRHESIRQILLVTSDFHMDRALYYFRRVFATMTITPYPAKSTLPSEELEARILHERNRLDAIQAREETSD